MEFSKLLYQTLNDYSTQELEIMIGCSMLKNEHGYLDLHVENNFDHITGQDTTFGYRKKEIPLYDHLTDTLQSNADDFPYKNKGSNIESCLDPDIGKGRFIEFIEEHKEALNKNICGNETMKYLILQRKEGYLVTLAIVEILEELFDDSVPIVPLSIVLMRKALKNKCIDI
ncbi:MAG: hypothetical protein ACEPOV_11220 [Hyphomicrobiales bacterium]